MNEGAWWAIVHRVTKSQTRQKQPVRAHSTYINIYFTYAGIPGSQLVKNLPVMGRPGFNPWVGKGLWRRKQLPNPIYWPGEFHGLYSCKELQRVGHD